MIGIATSAAYQVLNAFFLSGLGTGPLAASLLVFPLATALSAVGQCFGAGAASLISRRLGSGDFSAASTVASCALAWALALAGGIGLGIVLMAVPLLQALGASSVVLSPAGEYLPWLMLGYGLVVANMVCGFIVRAEGNTLFSMKTQLVAFCANALLDLLLIYHLDFGIRGAGIATIGGQLLALAMYVHHFGKKATRIRVALRDAQMTLEALRQLVPVGLPFALSPVLTAVAMGVANRYAAAEGDAYLAGFSLALRLFAISTLPLLGLSLGSQALFGYNYGARRHNIVRAAAAALLRIELAIAVVILVVVVTARAVIAGYFLDDPVSRRAAADTLMVVFLGLPFYVVSAVCTVYLQASGAASRAILLAVSRQGVLLLPLMALFASGISAVGISSAFPLAEALTALMAAPPLLRLLRERVVE